MEVKIRGHLEVKHLNLLYWTYGRLFIGFLYLEIHIWHLKNAQMSLEGITCHLEIKIGGQL